MRHSNVTGVETDVQTKPAPSRPKPIYPVVNAMRAAVPISILLWIAILTLVFR